MYQGFFKLKEEPFALTPDPRYLYMTPQHQEALGQCEMTIKEHRGMAVIFGEIGMGKTTITRRLFEILTNKPNYKVALLSNPAFTTENSLLQAIMSEFEVAPKRNYQKSLEAFQEFLFNEYQNGNTTVLLIDEAQKLTPRTMNVLHALDNFESNTDKFLQRVLIGQKELAPNIDAIPEIRSRVAIWGQLEPLTQDDTNDMIAFRWSTASGAKSSHPFSDKALEFIYLFSSGLPREINKLCYESLLRAYATESHEVTDDMVVEAAKALRLSDKVNQTEAAEV
jgi:general secretion pathway protein A